MLLPDHDGSVHGDLDRRAGARALRPARRHRRRRRAARGARAATGGSWTTATPTARSRDVRQRHPGLRPAPRAGGPRRPAPRRSPSTPATASRPSPSTATGHRRHGRARVLGETEVSVGERPGPPPTSTSATRTRSPSSTTSPTPGAARGARVRRGGLPRGVNVEFVVRRGEGHVAMRVHERGSGETQACGTGACAVVVAAMPRRGRARRTASTSPAAPSPSPDRRRPGADDRPGAHRGPRARPTSEPD